MSPYMENYAVDDMNYDPQSVTDMLAMLPTHMDAKELSEYSQPDAIAHIPPTSPIDRDDLHHLQQHRNASRPRQLQGCIEVVTQMIKPCLTSKSKVKNVAFDTVSVRVYDQCLGDHPCCSDGLPLSLDWTYRQNPSVDIDTYETTKQEQKQISYFKKSARLTCQERKKILEKTQSYQERRLKRLGSRLDRDQCSFQIAQEPSKDLGLQSFGNLDDLFTISLDEEGSCSCLPGKDLQDVFDVEMIDVETLPLVPSLEQKEDELSSSEVLNDATNTSLADGRELGNFREKQGLGRMNANALDQFFHSSYRER